MFGRRPRIGTPGLGSRLAHIYLQNGPSGGVFSTSLPTKLLSLVSPSRLQEDVKGGCVCEE